MAKSWKSKFQSSLYFIKNKFVPLDPDLDREEPELPGDLDRDLDLENDLRLGGKRFLRSFGDRDLDRRAFIRSRRSAPPLVSRSCDRERDLLRGGPRLGLRLRG